MTIFQTAVPKVRQTVVLRENRGSTMGEPTVGPKDQPTAALQGNRACTTAEPTAELMAALKPRYPQLRLEWVGADFGRLRLSGAGAWWLWGAIHVLFLAGARNRIVVGVQWFWAYLTYGRGIRLITGIEE